MSKHLYPWQQEAWQSLQRLRERLPHALLLHGAHGIGKYAFAERFAQSLLCENRLPDGQPCGQCASCGWFLQYSHPDYRRVRPEALDEDAEGSEAGEGEADSKKASKTPSKEIKIDQVRALGDFMNVSTHRQGARVALFYPAEAMNAAASNALLKTLEEPPPATVLILVSHQPERLLPTLVSRCRKLALPLPPFAQALAWLKEQGVEDGERWLAEQGGAPLAALEAAQGGASEEMDELLRALARPQMDVLLKTAERLQKAPLAELVAWLQRWVYDLFSSKLSGTIRYYPRYAKELSALAARAPTENLLAALKALNARRAVANHPLSPRLFIEDMLLEYLAIYSSRS